MSANEVAPVIIKKIKKGGGDGHHGGAWKVAYADFVTAMMAFFLLMWLLNATTEVQRKGIADYFNPTIPINRISGGGDGAFGGDNIFSEETLSKNGSGAAQLHATKEHEARGDAGPVGDKEAIEEETAMLKEVAEKFTARAGESMVSQEMARHIITKVTDEGLVVELFDLPDRPLFLPDSVEASPTMLQLIDIVAEVFLITKNQVAVNGHTSAMPIVVADNLVWDLSSGRAEVVRARLENGRLQEGRVQRVAGFADRKPVLENTMAVRNNRIEIILLRNVK